MKIGDLVIINPDIAVGTWNNSHTFTMREDMRQPGVFKVFSIQNDNIGIQAIPNITYVNDVTGLDIYNYQKDWLIPVPIFKVGDRVQIKEHLDTIKPFPYGFVSRMKELEKTTSSIEKVICDYAGRKIYNLGDDGCKYCVSGFVWSSLALTTIKNKNYENQLQGKETSVRTGSQREGSRICSRRCKVTIAIGRLSYKAIVRKKED